MHRRKFLQNTAKFLSLGVLINTSNISNAIPFTTAESSILLEQIPPESDKILVIINLAGGNDGLNTVIPLSHYNNLSKLRPKIIIPENKILKITDTVGLHPSLKEFQTLFGENKLCIIQNVGYPNQNRSHFRSADIWNSGSPSNEVWSSGWLGRYLEKRYDRYPEGYPNKKYPDPIAISIGNAVSETCQGLHTNFSFALDNPSKLINLAEISAVMPKLDTSSKELNFIENTIRQSNAYTKVITVAMDKGKNISQYDDNNKLAQQLKIVSRLISGGLKTKIYALTIDGFDTHANQVTDNDSTKGIHAEKLKIISSAIFSFQKDLNLLKIEKKVLGITTSEFGRQIKANSSLGTDHGSAAPLFLFGNNIKNKIIGDNPDIKIDVNEQEGVAMQFDFRDIYGSVLVDWFDVAQDDVRQLLYDGFNYMRLIK